LLSWKKILAAVTSTKDCINADKTHAARQSSSKFQNHYPLFNWQTTAANNKNPTIE
jgi:hypothetical protein